MKNTNLLILTSILSLSSFSVQATVDLKFDDSEVYSAWKTAGYDYLKDIVLRQKTLPEVLSFLRGDESAICSVDVENKEGGTYSDYRNPKAHENAKFCIKLLAPHKIPVRCRHSDAMNFIGIAKDIIEVNGPASELLNKTVAGSKMISFDLIRFFYDLELAQFDFQKINDAVLLASDNGKITQIENGLQAREARFVDFYRVLPMSPAEVTIVKKGKGKEKVLSSDSEEIEYKRVPYQLFETDPVKINEYISDMYYLHTGVRQILRSLKKSISESRLSGKAVRKFMDHEITRHQERADFMFDHYSGQQDSLTVLSASVNLAEALARIASRTGDDDLIGCIKAQF